MSLPEPVPALVIRYSYLWRSEHLRGKEEGVKDRPCAVIVVKTDADGEKMVTVLPITHTPPYQPEFAIEIPHSTKLRLGLDDARSWIMLNEANRFIWPSPDLRFAITGDAASAAYGLLPSSFFKEITKRLAAIIEARLIKIVSRSE